MNINNLLKEDFYSLSGEDEKAIVEHLASRLKIEFEKKDKSGIYGLTQYRFAYNSNHIEGSTLTENQTRNCFRTVPFTRTKKYLSRRILKRRQGTL